MFERILVSLDGSSLAEQILPYAKEHALRFGSAIHLFHVVEKPSSMTSVRPELIMAEQERIRSERVEAPVYLENLAAPLREQGVDVHCAIGEGPVGEAIIEYAQRNEIRLMAMATHGRTGLGRAVFGSVADFVLRRSGLPILIIKPRETDAGATTQPEPFRKILVCLDGSELAWQTVPYAEQEAIHFQSKLVLFHVVPEPVIVSPGIPGAGPVPVRTDTMLEAAQNELNEARDYLEGVARPLRERGIQVETVTILGKAGEAIVAYAERNDVNLVTMASHGRGGVGRALLGSVADHVLRESGLPILVVRARESREVQ